MAAPGAMSGIVACRKKQGLPDAIDGWTWVGVRLFSGAAEAARCYWDW
jgi:hypothetical protein